MSQNTRGSVRQPWLVPVLVAAVALGLFLAVALTRGGLAGDTLVVHFLVNGVVFAALAVAALIAYRHLRRTRNPGAMDDARSADRPR
jgi:membrane protein implicated in regulation of membrane protease activity